MGITIFDLDKTITKKTTTLTLGYGLFKNGDIPVRGFLKYIFKYTIAKFRDNELKRKDLKKMIDDVFTLFKGKDMKKINNVIEDRFRNNVNKLTYSASRELIERERDLGNILILATAAPIQIAQIFAEELKFHHVVSTEFEIVSNKLTGKLKDGLCHGENKLRMIEKKIKELQLNRDNITFFTDSYNDLPLIKAVKNATAINPDSKLKKYCKENNISHYSFERIKRTKMGLYSFIAGIMLYSPLVMFNK